MESIDHIASWQTSVGIYQHMTNQFGIIYAKICKNIFSNLLKMPKYAFCAISIPRYFLMETRRRFYLLYPNYKQQDKSRLSFVVNLLLPLKQENQWNIPPKWLNSEFFITMSGFWWASAQNWNLRLANEFFSWLYAAFTMLFTDQTLLQSVVVEIRNCWKCHFICDWVVIKNFNLP